MATLNLSTNGPSISKSYQSIVNAPPPTGPAAQSPNYAQWAVFSVSAPLANAFQQDTAGKESVLKVQSTGEGELVDFIDEFSDGRIQFAFAKIKDPNTTLPKSVLVAWCGEGVPERTKGYFTSHLAAVSKTLHGYHVQVTARSDRDLTPESIVQKVSDASGSKYSGAPAQSTSGPPPPVSSKPAFTPTRSSAGGSGYNPLASSRLRSTGPRDTNIDEDGWGADAPQVTRTQLEKVQSSYQPTTVNMRELTSSKPNTSSFNGTAATESSDSSGVVRGGYQPVGKVNIAELRRQAKETSSANDDRPTVVKGAYEPVGKVDIAAIRARAQPPSDTPARSSEPEQRPLPDRSAPFSSSERLTTLPRPKVANRFGSGAPSFTGTKAPTPGAFGLESKPAAAAPPLGVGRTFADQGGKSPAQIWAEKKARERGISGASENAPASATGGSASPIASQTSGGGQWKSGYAGKSWAPVETTRTGQSSSSAGQQETGADDVQEDAPTPAGGIGALRDRFKAEPPMGAASVGSARPGPSPPPLDTSSKPNAGRGIPIPGLPARPSYAEQDQEEEVSHMPPPPAQPPRSPTPPTPPAIESSSPIRVAMPVGRSHNDHEVEDAREEQFSPPPAMPARSLAQAVPHEDDLTEEPRSHDPARAAGVAAAAASFGDEAAEHAHPGAQHSGKVALVQYDYEKAEDNELELREGEYVTNIEMVDEDWWMGENPRGETGLFPNNYVELVDDDAHAPATEAHHQPEQEPEPQAHAHEAAATANESHGATATAMYDYEAAEGNELTFPENAKITNVEFPDEDWWSGEYGGHSGLFPASYVHLDE